LRFAGEKSLESTATSNQSIVTIINMNQNDISRIDLNLIKTFDAMLRTGSVTRAAQALHVGQPAMSHSLARLRDVLDDELFIRTASGMQPTKKAQTLAPVLRRALSDIEAAFLGSRSFDASTEQFEITVAMSDYSESVLLGPLLAQTATQAPNMTLRIVRYVSSTYRQMLDENKADIVVTQVRRASSWQDHEVLFSDERRCIFSRQQLPVKTPISMGDYLASAHVLVAKESERSTPIDRGLSKVGKRRRIGLVTPRFSTLAAALSTAPVIATLPARVTHLFDHDSDLVVSPLPFEVAAIEQSMIWNAASSNTPQMRWMLERMRNAVA